MAETVLPAQNNTDAGNANTDVKASETLLSTAETVTPKEPDANSDQLLKVDPKATESSPKDGDPKPEVKDEGKKEEKQGAPEKYEFKAAEGVTLDEELVTKLSTIAKEHELPQEAAQKYADLGQELVEKTVKGVRAATDKAWADAKAAWLTEIKADPEYGGANLIQSKEIAARAIRFVGIPELQQVFDSGWGVNPALFKAFVKFGKAIGDDRVIDSDTDSAPKSHAERMYPKQS
jgi:hypothetical protein